MSTMISEVSDALKEAGASEEKARKAAEARASTENRFNHRGRAHSDAGRTKLVEMDDRIQPCHDPCHLVEGLFPLIRSVL